MSIQMMSSDCVCVRRSVRSTLGRQERGLRNCTYKGVSGGMDCSDVRGELLGVWGSEGVMRRWSLMIEMDAVHELRSNVGAESNRGSTERL